MATLSKARNPVGLDNWPRWRVTAITPNPDVRKPVDTPTRQVEALTATLTDDAGNTARRTLLVYAYLDDAAGGFLVGQVDHLDNSQG